MAEGSLRYPNEIRQGIPVDPVSGDRADILFGVMALPIR